MTPDGETNFLYLADCLATRKKQFFDQFQRALNRVGINYAFLPNTKDIWAVDYMPIQITSDRFVQFSYNPDYLREYKNWRNTISDVDSICKAIQLTPHKSEILVDGGNVVRSTKKVIMCDKVFTENQSIGEDELVAQLEHLLGVDKIIFIPTHPEDFIGHADGIVRFLDENNVLINKYSKDRDKERTDFARTLRLSLRNAGLRCHEVPYNPYGNRKSIQANGVYVNFLQMKGVVFVPMFGLQEDDEAMRLFEQFFSGQMVVPLESNDIADDGGVLNCISWNIQVDRPTA